MVLSSLLNGCSCCLTLLWHTCDWCNQDLHTWARGDSKTDQPDSLIRGVTEAEGVTETTHSEERVRYDYSMDDLSESLAIAVYDKGHKCKRYAVSSLEQHAAEQNNDATCIQAFCLYPLYNKSWVTKL